MSSPFINGRLYDVLFCESEDTLHEKGVAFEDQLGVFLIFVRKAGIGEQGVELEDQRVFINQGFVKKAVELPNPVTLDEAFQA